MSDEQLLARITADPRIMTGKPVVAGTRLTVEFIVGLLAHGATAEELIKEYPKLTKHDVSACLLFASQSLATTTIVPLYSESA